MKMLMNVRIPHEPFNTAVKNGSVGKIIGRIVEEIRPEHVYFIEQYGTRGAILIVNVEKSSQILSLAEPWFLNFKADCEFRVAMTPDDLQKANLDAIGDEWK